MARRQMLPISMVAALVALAVPASAAAQSVRVRHGIAASAGAGATGACLLSDSGTRDTPCQYLAGIELTARPFASPVRALAGARLAQYMNDYPADATHASAHYTTTAREVWFGAAWEAFSLVPGDAVELFAGAGRGFGRTEQREQADFGDPISTRTANNYWFAEIGGQLTHTSPRGWFASLRAAWTVMRFDPGRDLAREIGWQATPLLPRAELGVGVHF